MAGLENENEVDFDSEFKKKQIGESSKSIQFTQTFKKQKEPHFEQSEKQLKNISEQKSSSHIEANTPEKSVESSNQFFKNPLKKIEKLQGVLGLVSEYYEIRKRKVMDIFKQLVSQSHPENHQNRTMFNIYKNPKQMNLMKRPEEMNGFNPDPQLNNAVLKNNFEGFLQESIAEQKNYDKNITSTFTIETNHQKNQPKLNKHNRNRILYMESTPEFQADFQDLKRIARQNKEISERLLKKPYSQYTIVNREGCLSEIPKRQKEDSYNEYYERPSKVRIYLLSNWIEITNQNQ